MGENLSKGEVRGPTLIFTSESLIINVQAENVPMSGIIRASSSRMLCWARLPSIYITVDEWWCKAGVLIEVNNAQHRRAIFEKDWSAYPQASEAVTLGHRSLMGCSQAV